MSEELKPCPFCGEVPTFTYGPTDAFMSHRCRGGMTICTTVKKWNSRVPEGDAEYPDPEYPYEDREVEETEK